MTIAGESAGGGSVSYQLIAYGGSGVPPFRAAMPELPWWQPLKNDTLQEEEYQRVLAMVYRGENAILKVRDIAGSTNPEEADSTSIRGAYGRITTKGVFENVIHASAIPADSEREIKLWFKPFEIVGNIYPTKKATIDKHEELVWA